LAGQQILGAMVLGAVLAAAWNPALAAPGLVDSVDAPEAAAGTVEFGVSAGRLADGPDAGEAAIEVTVLYGFSDRLSLELEGEVVDEAGAGPQLDAVGFEGVLVLGAVAGLNTGAAMGLAAPLRGGPAEVEARLLLQREVGRQTCG
jgi:hypothetical protein